MKRILTIAQLMVLLIITATGISVAQERFGGATLYTVRDQMAKAPMETLKAVADAGYHGVIDRGVA